MGWVTIRHPVTGGEAQVDERSTGHWVGCGWELAEPEPEAAEGNPATQDMPSPRSTRQGSGPDQQEKEE